MRPQTALHLLGLCATLLVHPLAAQKDSPKPAPAGQEALLKMLRKEKISLDVKNRRMSIPVRVNRIQHDLEYLLIYRTGKKHESMMITEAKPSLISVGLVALGAQRGSNANMVPKDPQPTEEEMKKGVSPYRFVPPMPKGPKIYMTVRYKDGQGRRIERPIEELILDYEANLTVTDNQWVFLGGRMAQMYRNEPKVFMADYEGNLISLCYMHPPNHLLTMMHKRSRDEMNWMRAPSCPPVGTQMDLVFHLREPEVRVTYRQRMAKEAEERRKKGLDVDKTDRPTRNPARPGGAPIPPRPKKPGGRGQEEAEKQGGGKKQGKDQRAGQKGG